MYSYPATQLHLLSARVPLLSKHTFRECGASLFRILLKHFAYAATCPLPKTSNVTLCTKPFLKKLYPRILALLLSFSLPNEVKSTTFGKISILREVAILVARTCMYVHVCLRSHVLWPELDRANGVVKPLLRWAGLMRKAGSVHRITGPAKRVL